MDYYVDKFPLAPQWSSVTPNTKLVEDEKYLITMWLKDPRDQRSKWLIQKVTAVTEFFSDGSSSIAFVLDDGEFSDFKIEDVDYYLHLENF